MRHEDILRLLSGLGSQGRAESEDPIHLRRSFYAVPEHIRALDPDVTLVLGSRGAGKTSLFRAISEFGLTDKLRARFPRATIPTNAEWVPVRLESKTFPPQEQLREFFESKTLDETDAAAFWEGTLVRTLWARLLPEDHASCEAIDSCSGSSVGAIVSAAKACRLVSSEALDRLDDRLVRDERILFVGYDDLDLLVKWTGAGVTSLMAYWAIRSRRWKGIRTKLFMRTDLYSRFGVTGGPDLAKIAANRVTLSWSDQGLLGMLVKRILNAGDIALVIESLGIPRSAVAGDEIAGWSLEPESLDELNRIITALLGPYMGAGPKKGATQRWIINHIKDCKNNAVPRFLVRLIESASEKQLDSGNEYPTILSPLFIREALADISGEHIVGSSEEWRWLPDFKERIKRSPKIQSIPFEKKTFETEMAKRWNDSWEKNLAPPCPDPRDFLSLLEDCGIMRVRYDGRYETTDLYLDGLGFRRKGGVKKRNG